MGNLSGLQQLGVGLAGVGALNSGVSGLAQYESGQAQKKADDYNAAVDLQETRDKAQTSEAKYSNLIGRQATAYAAAGIDISSGSALLMMAHTAAQSAAEQESEVQAGDEQAALQRYYGRVAAFNGTIGGISTFISGLSKSLTSVAGIMGPSMSRGGGGSSPDGDG